MTSLSVERNEESRLMMIPPRRAAIFAVSRVVAAMVALACFASCKSVEQPVQPSTPTPAAVYTNAVGGEMVYIPTGEFWMGSDASERPASNSRSCENEGKGQRRGHVKHRFWMGKTEVTVREWWKFIKATGYQTDATRGLAATESYPQQKPEDHPIAWITWSDATVFCDWLTQKEKAAGRLPPGYVMRLPTEAEWEYACRGPNGKTAFWWGDSSGGGRGRETWSEGENARSSAPVGACGKRGLNGFGLSDMLGNVREFCLDAWDNDGGHVELNADYTNNKQRVVKGGSFKSEPADARCARRIPCVYSFASSEIGLRICCGVSLANARPVWGKRPEGNQSMPPTVARAVDYLMENLTQENLDKVRYMKQEALAELRLGLGDWVLDNFGLLKGNKDLLRDCRTADPAEASDRIIEALWKRLQ